MDALLYITGCEILPALLRRGRLGECDAQAVNVINAVLVHLELVCRVNEGVKYLAQHNFAATSLLVCSVTKGVDHLTIASILLRIHDYSEQGRDAIKFAEQSYRRMIALHATWEAKDATLERRRLDATLQTADLTKKELESESVTANGEASPAYASFTEATVARNLVRSRPFDDLLRNLESQESEMLSVTTVTATTQSEQNAKGNEEASVRKQWMQSKAAHFAAASRPISAVNSDDCHRLLQSTVDDAENIRNEIRQLHHEVAGLVNGVSKDVFGTLTKRALFAETRRFSTRASLLKLPNQQIFQAGRNAWTCFALQVIYNSQLAACTDAVFGYSMLYPYTDNFLDDPEILLSEKWKFQLAFERRLQGVHSEKDMPDFVAGQKAFEMVGLIENDWDRAQVPEVFLALVAINDAQTWSLFQHQHEMSEHASELSHSKLLEQSVYKGGTSVLADAHMVDGSVGLMQSAFAFALGYGLQIVDDLQDTFEDLEACQHTIFTIAHVLNSSNNNKRNSAGASSSTAFGDAYARRLAWYLHYVCHSAKAESIDAALREILIKMTWNMVLKAIARAPALFSEQFQKEWRTLGPLPAEKMAQLQSLKTLHELAITDRI
ncbi:hypothetical protein CYMTET_8559 [Cymbomonas tetramitiformis]|uniref:Uncharacterized protein n=1 Tax=Cymbomonas tetramitiformis TaxID=36881 RepID=A0AAE0LFW0_9CHLO|nr:hypothetical protein CYMTET_8559 [Cymbomonas tetramitiformis]